MQTIRSLAKTPGFAALAVLMIALGVGTSTACFSFLNAFFLRPPPFERPAELVSLHAVDEKTPGLMRLSYPNFTDYRAQNTVFAGLAMHSFASVRFSDGEKNSNLFGQLVSGDYFELLGVKAALGRTLLAGDDKPDGTPAVVVVSHGFWQDRLGADPAVLGRSLTLNGIPFTVVGVAPVDFKGISAFSTPNFWMPESMHRNLLTGQALDAYRSRRAVVVNAFGRLKPGVTMAQADAALKPLSQRLATDYPRDNGGRSHRLVPLAEAMLDPNTRADLWRAGNLLLALSGLIMLIACANLANLLLSRTAARMREMALRLALGANRRQIVGQLLRENFLLALVGGALGVVLAIWLRDLLWMLRPSGFPAGIKAPIDGAVLSFALAATLLTGLLFGLVPALSAARVDLISILKREPASGTGASMFTFRHLLVGAQIALSVVALVIAGLFVRSLQRAHNVNLGWNSQNLAVLSANLGSQGYDQRRALEYYQRGVERLRTIPGVVDVSLASRPFLTGVNPQRTIRPQGADEIMRTRGQFMSYACVFPDYLRFMGIGVIAGRDFSAHDAADRAPVVIVNETFARRYWPGENPVGKTIKVFGDEGLVEVVGVVRDIRETELGGTPAPFAYFPIHQSFQMGNVFHIRTSGDPVAMVPTLRKELQALDPAVELFSVSYEDILHFVTWGQRTGAILMSIFGTLAMLLASLGIYAVMAQAITQRTREIGVRLALGAQHGAVLGLVLKRGVLVAAIGLFAGLELAYGLTHYIQQFLFEVDPADPVAFGAVALLLGTVAVLACYFPARRATRVDPMVALRSE